MHCTLHHPQLCLQPKLPATSFASCVHRQFGKMVSWAAFVLLAALPVFRTLADVLTAALDACSQCSPAGGYSGSPADL